MGRMYSQSGYKSLALDQCQQIKENILGIKQEEVRHGNCGRMTQEQLEQFVAKHGEFISRDVLSDHNNPLNLRPPAYLPKSYEEFVELEKQLYFKGQI